MSKAKLIIADFNEIIDAVKNQLEKALFTVAGSLPSENEALKKITTLFTDIVITDMTGFDLARKAQVFPVIAAITDLSYLGQLPVFSFCLTGNYRIPAPKGGDFFMSKDMIKI